MAKRPPRTRDFDIEFAGSNPGPGENGDAIGWVFGVPGAFRDALDIKFPSSRQQKHGVAHWKRGEPPQRCFDVGHIFYNPGEARRLIWRDALRVLVASIQVVEATPDTLDGAGGVIPGGVTFAYTRYVNGVAIEPLRCTATQAQFEEILRTGTDTTIRMYA